MHVELARQLVPDFEAAPEAPDGELRDGTDEDITNAQPGDLVLCRANAPIVQACLRAVSRRQRATVRGRSIGDQLGQTFRRIGDFPTIPQWLRGLALWRAQEMEKLDAKDGSEPAIEALNDRADCLEAIANTCGSPAEVPGVISSLFSDEDSASRITFSSVHRAKGSEARNVFYIRDPLRRKTRPDPSAPAMGTGPTPQSSLRRPDSIPSLSNPGHTPEARPVMRVKTIAVVYGRKLNLGDYNSVSIEVSLWADLDTNEDVNAALNTLQEQAREAAKAEAMRLKKPTSPTQS